MLLVSTQLCFLVPQVSDPRIAGNPIIFASSGFLELTGYPVERVLGRNCRFLQGPETDPASVAQMREAIDRGEDVSVTVLNYRHDGTTFLNNVMISGIRDATNQLLYYVGLQCIADEIPEEEEILNDDCPSF
jgi:PAS domain S-box-containing protein